MDQNWQEHRNQTVWGFQGKRGRGIRNGESMSSDFCQIRLRHRLFTSSFLWLHFILFFFFSMITSEALLSLSFLHISLPHSLLPSPLFVSSLSFWPFISVFRSQRDMAVRHTVVLGRFVAWPLVMEELRSSGPLAVQRAPPDEHCTRPPPQEPSRMVSAPGPLLRVF